MLTINISKPEEYYSQRNNEIRGTSACNVTSAAEFIEIAESKMPFVPKGMSLDDFLMATLLGKEGYENMFRLADTLYPEYTPNEIHACLSWAINRVCGKTVSMFKTNWSLNDLIFSIVKEKPVIISGLFNGLHHIVLLVGFQTSQEDILEVKDPAEINISKITTFIIDDPWGDPNSNYTIEKGDNVELTYRQFMDSIKPLGSTQKWGHVHKDIVMELLK